MKKIRIGQDTSELANLSPRQRKSKILPVESKSNSQSYFAADTKEDLILVQLPEWDKLKKFGLEFSQSIPHVRLLHHLFYVRNIFVVCLFICVGGGREISTETTTI